jgi:hypothetical protein
MLCQKCDYLMELYNQVKHSPRNYWLMTELFVLLHGGDVCEYAKKDKILDSHSSGGVCPNK